MSNNYRYKVFSVAADNSSSTTGQFDTIVSAINEVITNEEGKKFLDVTTDKTIYTKKDSNNENEPYVGFKIVKASSYPLSYQAFNVVNNNISDLISVNSSTSTSASPRQYVVFNNDNIFFLGESVTYSNYLHMCGIIIANGHYINDNSNSYCSISFSGSLGISANSYLKIYNFDKYTEVSNTSIFVNQYPIGSQTNGIINTCELIGYASSVIPQGVHLIMNDCKHWAGIVKFNNKEYFRADNFLISLD